MNHFTLKKLIIDRQYLSKSVVCNAGSTCAGDTFSLDIWYWNAKNPNIILTAFCLSLIKPSQSKSKSIYGNLQCYILCYHSEIYSMDFDNIILRIHRYPISLIASLQRDFYTFGILRGPTQSPSERGTVFQLL